MDSLDGKRVLITGATGGIGYEMCRRLVSAGTELTVVSSSLERGNELLRKLDHPDGEVIEANLADATGADVLAGIVGQREAYDIAILNAGSVTPKPVQELSALELESEIQLNLVAPTKLISALSKRMIETDTQGHIIATVSTGGILALPAYAAYSGSKAGLRAVLWSAASDLKEHGIKVTGLYLSAIDTKMLQAEAAEQYGSPLNFVGSLTPPTKVAERVMKVLAKPKLEVYLPYFDGLFVKVTALSPSLFNKLLLPLMTRIGRRGQRKYLSKIQTEIDLRDTASDKPRTKIS